MSKKVTTSVTIVIVVVLVVIGMRIKRARMLSQPQQAQGGLAAVSSDIPTLLGFGLVANLLGPKLRGGLQSFAAVLIMLFAIQTILRGLAVANVIPSFSYGQVMLW